MCIFFGLACRSRLRTLKQLAGKISTNASPTYHLPFLKHWSSAAVQCQIHALQRSNRSPRNVRIVVLRGRSCTSLVDRCHDLRNRDDGVEERSLTLRNFAILFGVQGEGTHDVVASRTRNLSAGKLEVFVLKAVDFGVAADVGHKRQFLTCAGAVGIASLEQGELQRTGLSLF